MGRFPEIIPLSSCLGARVEGIDLREDRDPETVAAIRKALREHLVLVFPEQALSEEQQLDFASAFAAPEPHPVGRFFGEKETVVHVDNELIALPDESSQLSLGNLAAHGAWHTDYSFSPRIPEFATLRAEVLPPVGGDTLWCNTIAAYEALSPVLRDLLDGLKAVHWHGPHFAPNFGISRHGPDAIRRFEEAFPPREHPAVISQPETGRPALFVNPSYTTQIVGMTAAESESFLHFLFRHTVAPRFLFRHHWSPDDLVMWDEHATLHLAPTDFHPHRRRLVRVAVGSVVPGR